MDSTGIFCIFATELTKIEDMDNKKTYTSRSKEEVNAWFRRAKERKQAWEEQTELELKAMEEESRKAKESHYFDFAL